MENVPALDLDDLSPAAEWDRDAARRALDDLFSNARQYNSSKAFRELVDFVARFRFYSPFNAMLIHIQMSGAKYAAPAYRWARDYERRIKAGARPLVILQPRGPVMFVFDVADTEPLPGAPPLPAKVERPFEVRRGSIAGELKSTAENAKRDGISVTENRAGSQRAGSIQTVAPGGNPLRFQTHSNPEPKYLNVPLRYALLLNSNLSAEARYATLVHELAHLYCGHLGTPNEKWWPDRRGLRHAAQEFEAESVCFLVCERLGIDNPSDEYLAGYVGKNEQIPPISLDCVMKAAGLIERMGRERLGARKEKNTE
jgi:IrrE N-terminal-like domain